MKDLVKVKKEVKRLQRTAEQYPLESFDKVPDQRHWAVLPGKVKICFTKKDFEGEWYYNLSISAIFGKVNDLIAEALLSQFNAPDSTLEVPPGTNPNVRHFMWRQEELKH